MPAEENARLVRREEAPPIRVGFGENTLSPQGAALATLDSNLKAAENVVELVGELRERARVTEAEQSAESPAPRPPERSDEFPRVETLRPEADPAVRNFVQETGALERPYGSPAPEVATATSARPIESPPAPSEPFPGTNANRIDIFA